MRTQHVCTHTRTHEANYNGRKRAHRLICRVGFASISATLRSICANARRDPTTSASLAAKAVLI
jgi:hypothetical protein